MILQLAGNVRETEKVSFYQDDLSSVLGLEMSVVFSKLQWCIENTKMEGTVIDGVKYIRNPITCTDADKIISAETHGKYIDWLSNFVWATRGVLRRIFAKLEAIGLIIVKKLRANKHDQCKYYAINYQKLAEVLERPPLPICSYPTNRFVESEQIDLLTADKSYQNTYSKEVFQDQHPQDARAHKPKPTIRKEGVTPLENQKEDRIAHDSEQEATEVVVEEIFLTPVNKEEIVGSTTEIEGLDQFSARLSSVNQAQPSVQFSSVNQPQQRDFFYKLIMYAQQCVNINSPEGYVKSTIRELKSSDPDPIAQLLWEEYLSGEELGSRFAPFGHKLRGVPEQIIKEAMVQDQRGKVGTTGTEAAASAARNMAKAPIVRAVADAIRQQLTRSSEDAQKQVEMGIPREQAIANCLPSYATAVAPVGSFVEAESQNLIASAVEADSIDENVDATNTMAIARAKIGEILNKFQRKTPKQRILEANQQEVEAQVSLVVKPEVLEPVGSGVPEYLREFDEAEEIW